MAYWEYYTPSKPREVKHGIKAKNKRGQFGNQWWSQRWVEVLESFGWANRLQRGRTYARKGQVIDLHIEKGKITSRVQGSRARPYSVTIEISQLSASDWQDAIGVMAEQALFAAKLLAGEMPQNIEQSFHAAGVRLFPSSTDLKTNCSCPDWANPCKHIAAVYYLLGERFDEDPFFLFLLRGYSKEEFITALRQQRGAEETVSIQEDEPTVEEIPPALSHEGFWDTKEPLSEMHFDIHAPEVQVGSLKRLGEPTFWTPSKSLTRHFEFFYAAMSKKAGE